jgi:hypothetical protein
MSYLILFWVLLVNFYLRSLELAKANDILHLFTLYLFTLYLFTLYLFTPLYVFSLRYTTMHHYLIYIHS